MNQPQSIADIELHRRCADIGWQFSSVEAEITQLKTESLSLQQNYDRTQNKIYEIDKRLVDISVLNIGTTVLGMYRRFGVPLNFGLDLEKSDLEIERQNLSALLEELERKLRQNSNHTKERQAHASRLSNLFMELNCPLGLKPVG